MRSPSSCHCGTPTLESFACGFGLGGSDCGGMLGGVTSDLSVA